VIDPRTLTPLDTQTLIRSVEKTGRALIVQECWPHCSFGSDTAYTLMSKAFDSLDAPVRVISSANVPFPYSFPLEKLALPSTEQVIEAAKEIAAKQTA
jgi:pyruvate/2-oxoglutarate/acetoin dehydrogenase E1 component